MIRYTIPMHYFIFPNLEEFDKEKFLKLKRYLSIGRVIHGSIKELSSPLMNERDALLSIGMDNDEIKSIMEREDREDAIRRSIDRFLKDMRDSFYLVKSQVYRKSSDFFTFHSSPVHETTAQVKIKATPKGAISDKRNIQFFFDQNAYPFIFGLRTISEEEIVELIDSKDTPLIALSLMIGMTLSRKFIQQNKSILGEISKQDPTENFDISKDSMFDTGNTFHPTIKPLEERLGLEDFCIDIPILSDEISYFFSEINQIGISNREFLNFLLPLVDKINHTGYYDVHVENEDEDDNNEGENGRKEQNRGLIVLLVRFGEKNVRKLKDVSHWGEILHGTLRSYDIEENIVDEDFFLKERILRLLENQSIPTEILMDVERILRAYSS